MQLKQATIDDVKILFDWVNDETIRANAFNPNKIEFENHQHWLHNKVCSSDCMIYIGYEPDVAIGQVRFDRHSDDVFMVDIHVAPTQQKKGYAKTLLKAGITKGCDSGFLSANITIRAEVFVSNAASTAMFEACGFNLINTEVVCGIECHILTFQVNG